MAKTYHMTDETKQEAGHEVHRIVATKRNRWAESGTIGGWIENENNLEDGAWVADEAYVYGDARVYGNTLVEDNAKVYGNAHFHGTENAPAMLSFDRILHGGDWSEAPYAQMCGDWTTQITSPDTFRIGCQDHSFERWKTSYRAIMRYCMKIAPVDENTIKEAVEAYNKCCSKYMKHEYTADLDHILIEYKKRID